MSGNIPSVPGANTELYLSHFWHPMWDWRLKLILYYIIILLWLLYYCMGHKGRWALFDIQLSLHPNKLIPINLCIVMSNPVTTHVLEFPVVLCYWSPAGMMFWTWCMKFCILKWTFNEQWTFDALNFVWYQHSDINFIIVTYIFCYIYCYNSVY